MPLVGLKIPDNAFFKRKTENYAVNQYHKNQQVI